MTEKTKPKVNIFDRCITRGCEGKAEYCANCMTDNHEQGKQAGKTELMKENVEDYLVFLFDQMECRRAKEEGKIGRDERSTTEYLMLNMCWQEFVKNFYGWFPMLHRDENRELFAKIENKWLAAQTKEKEG